MSPGEEVQTISASWSIFMVSHLSIASLLGDDWPDPSRTGFELCP